MFVRMGAIQHIPPLMYGAQVDCSRLTEISGLGGSCKNCVQCGRTPVVRDHVLYGFY